MIKFRCGCGKKVAVPEKYTGKRVKCPGCGGVIFVAANPVQPKAPISEVTESPSLPPWLYALFSLAVATIAFGAYEILWNRPDRTVPAAFSASSPPAMTHALPAEPSTNPTPPAAPHVLSKADVALAAPAPLPQPKPEAPKELTATELFSISCPAVARVLVQSVNGEFVSFGSGFFVRSDGVLVTNFHVIDNAPGAVAELNDGRRAAIVGVMASNSEADLAILKIDVTEMPILRLHSQTPPVGTKVFAIGYPAGLKNSLSEGLISGTRDGAGSASIQTTAAISPGSSGGPLLDSMGRVVGVTTLTLKDAQNLNFAVPAATVELLLRQVTAPQPLQQLAAQRAATIANSLW